MAVSASTPDGTAPYQRLRVSLLMPNYNHGRYLRTALRGLCEQTRPADEIIVVDDGSTDDSVSIIEEFAARHANLVLLRHPRNLGVFAAVDTALAACTGDAMAIVAADDRILPRFVERSAAHLEAHPQAGLCFSAYALMDADSEEVSDQSRNPAHRGAFDLSRFPAYLSPQEYRRQLRGGIIWMSGNTVLIRRKAFLEAGGLMQELKWHSDWFVNLVVALRHGACVVPEVLSAIRVQREDSFSAPARRDPRTQDEVIRQVVRTCWTARYADILWAFLRYPVLLSPLDRQVVPALLGLVRGWPLLPGYLSYGRAAWIVPYQPPASRLQAALAWLGERLDAASVERREPPGPATTAPTVTVLLSNYNDGRYLRDSVPALCEQTRPPDEVLIVDDGSTDDSLEVIEDLARRYPCIRVLRNDVNRGQLHGINRALREARGDYINWAAADDRVAPEFFERTLACIARHPGVGVCQSEYALFDDSSVAFQPQRQVADVFDFSKVPEYMCPWRYREWLKDGIVWLSTNGALVRRDALLEMNAYHEDMAWHADWFSAQTVALRYGICVVPEALAALRVRASSYSADGMRDRVRHPRVLDAIFAKVREHEFADIGRCMLRLPAIWSALGPAVYTHLRRRPALWHYLLASRLGSRLRVARPRFIGWIERCPSLPHRAMRRMIRNSAAIARQLLPGAARRLIRRLLPAAAKRAIRRLR